MCEDIQNHGQPANRLHGGVHHRVAGKYVSYINAKQEFGSAVAKTKNAKVIDTKTKNATYRGWTLKELKDKCCELEDENEDLHNQVYHKVCIVSVCLFKSGVMFYVFLM